MQVRRKDIFTTIRTEGSILPPDLLQRIDAGDHELEGLEPEDYHLARGERLNEAINRSWNRLLGVWASFKAGLEKLPADDPATTITRERWLLVLFQELGYGRLLTNRAVEIDGKSYPISHVWQHTPIHLVGCRINLDRRTTGVAGAARTSPHSLVQEYLNRSSEHLWGFVSNGFVLRILRDNVSLTRQSYVEFDLQSMMDGEVYADFALCWLLCHQSRIESERPEQCWLEKWSKTAQEQGTRVMDQLRGGVENAITAFGCGFLAHPDNRQLREKLQTGGLSTMDYYRQILRLVYRLIFLFVAEDRELLLGPRATSTVKDRYHRYYSTHRLRSLAARSRGTKHADLYRGLQVVMEKLGNEGGCEELGLPALGSFLWSEQAMSDLAGCVIANRDFLDAIRALAYMTDGHTRRPVDYKNLGSEELGSVYESLLELHPVLDTSTGNFELKTAGGNERKTTGSYYTPASLINCLLDSALDPVLNEAVKQKNPETAILNLKVCDPACGSGHFLIAAAHRIAKRLAAVRTGDDEPAPEAVRTALRDVIGRCIYGVDVNEMAVELCKVSLWMEALEPGKPLSFLDHRIMCGNSLLGATPALLLKGIPNEAFKPIEGDLKEVCSKYKKQNKLEREGQTNLLFDSAGEAWPEVAGLSKCLLELDTMSDDTLDDISHKEEQYVKCINSSSYQYGRLLADAWCAAFVWKKTKEFPYPITEGVFRKIEDNPNSIPAWMLEEIQRLVKEYQFFHWHLAFPDVFHLPEPGEQPENEQAGWNGGFDVVLGNPPWERVKLQEKEWFACRLPEIADAPNAAARRRMISALAEEDNALYQAFLADRRKAEGESHLIRNSLRYPLCGRGDVNTYAVFAETMRLIMGQEGRTGCIVPSGIATDDTTKYFFQDIMNTRTLVSLYDFENREGIFTGVHRSYKFCLLTLTGPGQPSKAGAEFVFFAHRVEDLLEPERMFILSAKDLALLNPNTLTCPTFRFSCDAAISRNIYKSIPVLVNERIYENPWNITIRRIFDMNKSDILKKCHKEHILDSVPVYEAKMVQQFNHRWATYTNNEIRELSFEKSDPFCFTNPRYWMPSIYVKENFKDKWDRNWLLVWRDITNSTNERTVIASILPWVATDFTLRVCFPIMENIQHLLMANLNSYVFDFCARSMLGGTHLSDYIMKQLPVIPPKEYYRLTNWCSNQKTYNWFSPRVLELTYTAWDLESFAQDIGYYGPPFRWDEDRRFLIRCELDAAYFHLYGIARDDVDYIMETFPIVKRKDEDRYGSYRTKEKILEIYDEMARVSAENAAGLSSDQEATVYRTRLDPRPGSPMDAEGNFISMYRWDRDNWPDNIHQPHMEWEESLLSAWFVVCQKDWIHLDGDQIFPWDGREAFVYASIPYLVNERPGEIFELYRDAALLASSSKRCETLLIKKELRDEYRQIMNDIDWLNFPDEQRIRPKKIRVRLQDNGIIQTDPISGATVVQNAGSLPPLPKELRPLLPLILKAVDNLNEIQRRASEDAKTAKISITQNKVTKELRKLMVV
jgi:hypothetical protein